MTPRPTLWTIACLLPLTVGCKATLAQPFDTLKSGNPTVLRLQNYEPPAQAAALPGAPTIPGFTIPPQIQQWAQQAAPALQQLLPPGLLPPELLGGSAALPAQPGVTQQGFRFHGRLVLGTAQVIDQDTKDKLAELFGDEDNFQNEHDACMYPELGLGWSTQPNMPNYELLISFSCNQVQAAQGFSWPHATGVGLKPKTVESLATIVSKLFPATGVPTASNGAQTIHWL
ncbi:MAG: hypothetical protein ABW217_11515 [Polyangiaceae bacterium]